METLYEQILKKPKAYRQRLSYILTAVVGIVIFAIWLVITTFSMRQAFDFDSTVNEIKESIPDETNTAPSFYDEQQKSLEENFNNLMNQQQTQDSTQSEN